MLHARCAAERRQRQVPRVAGAPTLASDAQTLQDSLAGRWALLDGGLILEFRADGSFVQHALNDGYEWGVYEWLETPGTYQVSEQDRLCLDLEREGRTQYEFRLHPSWLMLRDRQGTVTIYRREKE